MDREVTLNQEIFAAWLAGFDDGDIVGLSAGYKSCPIFHFVNALTGWTDHKVNAIDLELPGESIDLPDWAVNFISDVDRNVDDNTPITAHEAKLALRGELHRPNPRDDNDLDDEEDWDDEDYEYEDDEVGPCSDPYCSICNEIF